jgi:hypothetical protein
MATVITRNGRRSIQFNDARGERRTMGLGKVTQKQAESIKAKVEALSAAALTGMPPEDEVSRWLAKLDTVILGKLSDFGLIPRRTVATVGGFLGEYIASRIDVKPATKTVWSQVEKNLLKHFGADRSLRSITAGDCENFHMFLVGQKSAPTTVQKRLQFARQFFTAARKRKAEPGAGFGALLPAENLLASRWKRQCPLQNDACRISRTGR